MPDHHFENAALADLYDTTCGWSADRDFYLSLATRPRMDVLDLGCGTGLLCRAYAEDGHAVTGVDPAAAMLAVGRGKDHGSQVEWVQASAEDYRTDRRFDLIVMTGHAFQVLLTDTAVVRALGTFRQHLKADGSAVFESRNPRIDWRSRWHDRVREYAAPRDGFRQTTVVLAEHDGLISFQHIYELAGETVVSDSTIRFMEEAAIRRHLAAAGLNVRSLYGDWDASAFDPERSPEMIFEVTPG